MKAFKGWTISVGLLLAATTANAQGTAPQDTSRPRYLAASDFSGPNADVPPGPAVPAPVYGRPVYGPQGYGAQVGPGPSEYGPPLMPPTEVYAVLRENGFSPLGVPRLRGLFYSVSAIDRRGDDGRLVIDARNGRIVRFVPADRFSGLGGYGGYGDGYYGGAPRPSYGPLEPMTRLDAPRPPGALPPKIASRLPQSIPMPQAAPSRLGEKRPADAKPLADKLTPAAPMQQSAAVHAKPADVAPAAPSASPVEAKPAAPAIQATQPMPKVQGLE
ncbi:hypothetical protein [Bradyrhizobium sp.]|jgi:hypothetical protein|uniref:hypothetical protein n=1 Tax=Bradyrhizobium sp. TaxID=376 RepID=UPI003C28647D